MKAMKFSSRAMMILLTALLSMSGGLCFGADGSREKAAGAVKKGDYTPSLPKAASPYLEQKREMVRKQQEQRITQEKRKAGAEALKAERLKVYNAKQLVNQSQPGSGK